MMLSAVMEDYVKAIYHLQVTSDGRVKTSEIADRLGVTPPTVTSMVEKLADRELVDREKYGGVELTPDGERVALEVIRHHRLLEAYLTEHLDYPWSEVHEEADRLEHHISEAFEERVADALDDPHTDPHGDPIPSADLKPPRTDAAKTLSEFAADDQVTVVRVSDRDPEILEYLAERGVGPGVHLSVEEVAPFGMVTVTGGDLDGTVSLPERIARGVHVEGVEAKSRPD